MAELGQQPLQCGLGQLGVGRGQGLQRAEAVGHVAGVLDLLVGAAGPDRVAGLRGTQAQHGQCAVGQRAAARLLVRGSVAFGDLVRLPGPLPVGLQRPRQVGAELLAHALDAGRIHALELFGDVGLGGQREDQRLQGRVEGRVAQHAAHGLQEGLVQVHLGQAAVHGLDDAVQRQLLAGFPAVEGVGVVRQQYQAPGIAQAVVQVHRGGEPAHQRGHGVGRDVLEDEVLLGLIEHEQPLVGQRGTVRAEQCGQHRDHEGRLLGLPRGGGAALRQGQRVAACFGVVVSMGGHARRARLRVPALEGLQPDGQRAAGVGIGDGLGEVVAGHGMAVVALEVQVHAGAEALAAHQRLHHAHHLGALLVDGGGVEVVDGRVAVGAHRVRHRAGVLGELGRAQPGDVLDALGRARRGAAGHVHRELLVAEDGEAFLERELEPVAAGDAVAGPVVEVLVGHHALDARVVLVGGGGRRGQHELGVEQVQALVLHRPHVVVLDGHDHVAVQVQRQPEAGLVPHDGGDQRAHGVLGLAQVALADVDLQQVLLAAAAADALLACDQPRSHQCEQVAGLGEGVVPLRVVATVVQAALLDEVAVGQQHRVARLVGAQRDREDGHHVRAVQEVGDAPETLGLALREQARGAEVQARQFGVLVGGAGVADLQREFGRGRGLVDHQQPALLAEGHAGAVGQHAQRVQALAVELQGLAGRGLLVALDAHLRGDQGLGGVQVEDEFDFTDPEGRGGVVLAADDGGVALAHGRVLQ